MGCLIYFLQAKGFPVIVCPDSLIPLSPLVPISILLLYLLCSLQTILCGMVELTTFATFDLALVKTIIHDMISETTCSTGIFQRIA